MKEFQTGFWSDARDALLSILKQRIFRTVLVAGMTWKLLLVGESIIESETVQSHIENLSSLFQPSAERGERFCITCEPELP